MEGVRATRYTGVISRKNGTKWGAHISRGGRQTWLGIHATEKEAALAYDRACLKLGSFVARKADLAKKQGQPASGDTGAAEVPEERPPVMLFGARIG